MSLSKNVRATVMMCLSLSIASGTPLVLVSPAAYASQTSGLTDENEEFLKEVVEGLHMNFRIASITGISGRGEGPDVTQQYLGITLSNQNKLLRNIMKENLGKEPGYDIRNGFIVEFKVEGTTSGMVVRDKVEKKALDKVQAQVDAEVSKQKALMYRQAPKLVEQTLRAQVTAEVNQNPALVAYSANQKAAIIDSQVQAHLPTALKLGLPLVHQKIDAQVGVAQQQATQREQQEHVYRRMDEIVGETGIQTVEVSFAIPFNLWGEIEGKPRGLFIGSFGKAHPRLGAETKSNGLSQWENIIGHSNIGERGNTVASTGYASVGVSYSVDKNLNLNISFIGYHDRDPWISAQEYIGRSLAIAGPVFDKYQKVVSLNAAGTRVQIDAQLTPNVIGQFWGTVIKRFDPNESDRREFGYSFGGTVSAATTGTTINFAYANSGKAYFNETYSVGVAQTVLKKMKNTWQPGVTVYTDFRGYKHLPDSVDRSLEEKDEKLLAFGSKVDICKFVSRGFFMNCALVGEYQKVIASSEANPDTDNFYLGMMADIQY